MALQKTHKRKKYSRAHGRGMGTAGTGSRKNAKKAGHHGGNGMAGTGKRADQKKTLITKLYGNSYFGKQGITSKGTKRDKRERINLFTIETNLLNYVKKGIAKKKAKGYTINLENYKILGTGEVKRKLIINSLSASKSAIEKVEKAGGELILKESADEEGEFESVDEEQEAEE